METAKVGAAAGRTRPRQQKAAAVEEVDERAQLLRLLKMDSVTAGLDMSAVAALVTALEGRAELLRLLKTDSITAGLDTSAIETLVGGLEDALNSAKQ